MADLSTASLPKADLHVHQEWAPRLDRVLASRQGRPPFDWRGWQRQVVDEVPAGMARFHLLSSIFPVPSELDADPENFVARVQDLLTEAAGDGAVFVEVRFGNETVLRSGFMELFREAEQRVRKQYPSLCAEAVVPLLLWYQPERLSLVSEGCLRAAREGLAGIDLLYKPYDTQAGSDMWATAYRCAERAAEAGLGVTVHAGEFSPANIEAALRVPGLTRVGHAVHAAFKPSLLERLARTGVTVECALTCNVVLGAVSSYEEHPIRRFVEQRIPVALCTDNPVQMCTTIGQEYAAAQALGFSSRELLEFTRNAVSAAFTTPSRRQALIDQLDQWASRLPPA